MGSVTADIDDAATFPLRPLTVDDVPDMARMEVELFGGIAWSAETLVDEITGPGRWYVGAYDDERLVGYAGVWFDGYDAQVMTIATDTPYQNRGIGRLLLGALMAHAREVEADAVLLEVRVDNAPALHLYESCGFEQIGVRHGYYQPENVDAWTMRKALV